MTDKVYVVTQGSYSDYHIDCIFLNKKDAEKYLQLCRETNKEIFNDYNDLEEYIVGEHYQNGNVKFQVVFFEKDGGQSVRVYPYTDIMDCHDEYSRTHRYYVFASNKEEALKIASERHRAYLAEKSLFFQNSKE